MCETCRKAFVTAVRKVSASAAMELWTCIGGRRADAGSGSGLMNAIRLWLPLVSKSK